MKLYRYDEAAARPITHYESHDVKIAHLLNTSANVHLAIMYFHPGGKVGLHPAVAEQLFLVVQGEGWVQGEDGKQQPIQAGQAALWDGGEQHASETTNGMSALVLEGNKLSKALGQSKDEP